MFIKLKSCTINLILGVFRRHSLFKPRHFGMHSTMWKLLCRGTQHNRLFVIQHTWKPKWVQLLKSSDFEDVWQWLNFRVTLLTCRLRHRKYTESWICTFRFVFVSSIAYPCYKCCKVPLESHLLFLILFACYLSMDKGCVSLSHGQYILTLSYKVRWPDDIICYFKLVVPCILIQCE